MVRSASYPENRDRSAGVASSKSSSQPTAVIGRSADRPATERPNEKKHGRGLLGLLGFGFGLLFAIVVVLLSKIDTAISLAATPPAGKSNLELFAKIFSALGRRSASSLGDSNRPIRSDDERSTTQPANDARRSFPTEDVCVRFLKRRRVGLLILFSSLLGVTF